MPVFTGPLQLVRNGSKLVPHAVSAGSLLYAECRAMGAPSPWPAAGAHVVVVLEEF